MSVVATFAHELCHYQLLGGKRVGRDEPDHEPLTDLAVIFFGFGIFAANASFRSSSYSSGNWHYTSMKRQGYLPPPVLGYGLALYALLREEANPDWVRYVRPDVREPMRKALAYLSASDAVELGLDASYASQSAGTVARPARTTWTATGRQRQKGMPPTAWDQDMITRTRFPRPTRHLPRRASPSTQGGTMRLRSLFQKVIDDQPDDGEAYAQLALTCLKLNRAAEAIAAAGKAIEISPGDADALQTRGSAYLELGRCGEAVDDLATSLAIDRDAKRLGRMAETAYLLGKARARQGEHHQAIRYFSLAINELPTWATPYESRAEVYERLGEAEKAAADRDEAVYRRNAL